MKDVKFMATTILLCTLLTIAGATYVRAVLENQEEAEAKEIEKGVQVSSIHFETDPSSIPETTAIAANGTICIQQDSFQKILILKSCEHVDLELAPNHEKAR